MKTIGCLGGTVVTVKTQIYSPLSAEQDVTKKYIKKEKVEKAENPADFSVQKNLILSTPKAKIPKLSKY